MESGKWKRCRPEERSDLRHVVNSLVVETAPAKGQRIFSGGTVGRKSAALSDKAFVERPGKGAAFFAVERAPVKNSALMWEKYQSKTYV